jgi:linoleoyl-CoA desaturase
VQALFEKYNLNYCARPLVPQVYSAWHKVLRLSLPNDWLDSTTRENLPEQLVKLYKMVRGTPRERRAIQASLTRSARARRAQQREFAAAA